MRTKINGVVVLLNVTALFLTLSHGAFSSPNSSAQSEISSPDWHLRELAFLDIQSRLHNVSLANRADAKSTQDLRRLLLTEIHFSRRTSVAASEEYSEYVGELTEFIIGLHDPIFIDPLFDPELLNAGNMVTEGIASFGDLAIPKELAAFRNSPDRTTQLSLTRVAMQMLEQHTVHNPTNLSQLNDVLLMQSNNPDALVRICALDGLSRFGNSVTWKRISEIAGTDAYRVSIDGSWKYPVREEASRLLAISH